jgi:protein MpaA
MRKSKNQESIEVYTNSYPDVTGNILNSLKSEDELVQKEDTAYIMADDLYHEKVYIEKSFEEREIKIYTFGKDSYENKIAILGSMHGDEPQGKYIIEQLLEYIKENPQIIQNNQILLIPCSNPDGLIKNKRGNANNVDLNRNFPTENWGVEFQDKNSRYYPGVSANSEPETNILIKYIEEFNPKIIINIHSPLKVINYDGFNSEDIANYMAKYNNYKTSADIGYSTPGSFGTYFGKERNIPVITLETGADELEKAWSENKESLIEVILKLNNFQ